MAVDYNDSLIILFLVVFALYRISTDFTWTSGPFGAYQRIRSYMGQRYGTDHWLAEGFNCPVCISFWLALPAGVWLGGNLWIVYWLGFAGLVAFLSRSQW